MPFSNLDYLYNHLPGRVRRDDDDVFLYRFLQFLGTNLDTWDAMLDNFYQSIFPGTASEEFVAWWLWALFGWSWFPSWYSLGRKRALYANFTYHLARRGTPVGIELFLREFSVVGRVWARPLYWGEFVWGESAWVVTAPLAVVVQVLGVLDEVNFDVRGMAWGEMVWGEGYLREVSPTLTNREIEDLLRFEWPNGHRMTIEYKALPSVSGMEAWDNDDPVLNEGAVPDELGGAVIGAN